MDDFHYYGNSEVKAAFLRFKNSLKIRCYQGGEMEPDHSYEHGGTFKERFSDILYKICNYAMYSKEKTLVNKLYEKLFQSGRMNDGATFTQMVDVFCHDDYLDDISSNTHFCEYIIYEFLRPNAPCQIRVCSTFDEVESLMCKHYNISDTEIYNYNEHKRISEELNKTQLLLEREKQKAVSMKNKYDIIEKNLEKTKGLLNIG